jgi:hypothetical protein
MGFHGRWIGWLRHFRPTMLLADYFHLFVISAMNKICYVEQLLRKPANIDVD